MRIALIMIGMAWASAGCQVQEPPARADVPATEAEPDRVEIETVASPDGRATLAYVDSVSLDTARLDRVLLTVDGETTEVFVWNLGKKLGIEWLAADLGRVWIPIGGNWHHASVFVEPSSRRVSPSISDDFAVDAGAGTVVSYDIDAFTLRDLWSGRELAAWSPPDLDLIELWQECEPSGTLVARAAIIRYNCGDGERKREMEW